MDRTRIMVVGCGKMGGSLLSGWLDDGLPKEDVCVVEANPETRASWAGRGLAAVAEAAQAPGGFVPDAILIAVKPQSLAAALPPVVAAVKARCGARLPLVLTIVAGKPISAFEAAFGPGAPVLRVMPNTPAAVREGVSGAFANPAVSPGQRALGERLLAAVSRVVWLTSEDQIHAVTALSGSGPAYVFHLVEAMAEAGEALGLSPDVAMALARGTVVGSGALLKRSPETAAALRIAVTSPGGTTAAALGVLMAEGDAGLSAMMTRAMEAAARRSRELAG